MMTLASPQLQLDEALWRTFSALLDGPSTARAVSDRLRRPLASIMTDMTRLELRGLIVEDGQVRMGGFVERRYRLPEGPIEVADHLALPMLLREVEQGFQNAAKRKLQHEGGLVAVRVSSDLVASSLRQILNIRENLEHHNDPSGDGVRFQLFTAGYEEESCTQ
jgi:hypothetical protein